MSCQPNPPRATARPRTAGQPPSAPPWACTPPTPMASPRRSRRSARSLHFPTLTRRPAVLPTWASREPGRRAQRGWHRRTVPDPGRDHPGRAGGQGRAGPWPYRLGQDPAFGLPMISRLAGSSGPARVQPRGLVLVPTRELAMQVADVLAPLARMPGCRWYWSPAACRTRRRSWRSPVVSTSWSRRPGG